MNQFILALIVFLALHMIPAIPALRGRIIARIGRRAYLIIYSLVSLLALAWLIAATLQLDYIPLWDAAPWQAHVTLTLMPIAFILLFAGLFSPNPLSITMRGGGTRPGAVTTITRHPVLWGFALWAASHILPNGDVRSVLLFGALLAFALLGMLTADRRAHRRLGDDWGPIAATTSVVPFAAVLAGRTRLRWDWPLTAALLLSVALTATLLLGVHAALFSVDPLALAGG